MNNQNVDFIYDIWKNIYEKYHLLTILLTFMLIFWSSIYYIIRCIFSKLSDEFICRIVTFIHGVIAVTLCISLSILEKKNPFNSDNYGKISTTSMQIVFSISLGYFIFDFLWCIMRHSEGFFMLFHHLCSITGLSVAIFTRRYGFELMLTILGSEITNPILQLRWFIKHSEHKCSNKKLCICSIVDLLFFVVFFLFRIVLGSILLHLYFECPHTDTFGRMGGLLIYVIGWGFWVQILRFAWRKYFVFFFNIDRK